MKRPDFIAEQARRPTGMFGWVIGSIMSHETSALNVATLDALNLEPHDRLLEVGFGHGRTIERAAGIVTSGLVAGIDLSETMGRMARKRCRRFIEQGRVQLEVGDSASLPFPHDSFDKAFSVHTIYFWTNPVDHLREIRRVLKPSGRLALGLRTKGEGTGADDFPEGVYTFYDIATVRGLLGAAGFGHLSVREAGDEGRFVIVTAEREP